MRLYPREAAVVRNVADVLAALLDAPTAAAVLNVLMSADADDRLSDYQVAIADRLFDRLCVVRPDACEIAAGAPLCVEGLCDCDRCRGDGPVIVTTNSEG